MEIPKMPLSLKDHIFNTWTTKCKGKGEEKERRYKFWNVGQYKCSYFW